MSSSTPNTYVVVLELPTPVPALIEVARSVVAAMTGNAFFPQTNPPLAQVTAAIGALDAAQLVTKSRAPGSIAARNAARAPLLVALRTLKAYVQQQADADPEQAMAIVTSARMTTRRIGNRAKEPFAARVGDVSGSVRLAVKAAAARASYEWEWSADGGKTWTAAPPTLQAKTTLTGLAPGAICLFRYRAVTKRGATDWSQPMSLVVR